jgi:hypothetical protein
VIADPPSLTGAAKLTLAEPSAGLAATPVGVSGTVAGVTETGADSTLSPIAFVACTVKVYAVPFVRPVTVQGLLEHDAEPVGEPVTV